MKLVLTRALFRAAVSLLVIFILMTVLQYIAWLQPKRDLILFIDYPNTTAEHYKIHSSGDIFCPWFLYFWPFNHPMYPGW